jgi:hypothetical protein
VSGEFLPLRLQSVFFPQREWQNFATRGAVKTCQLSAREKNEEKVDCSSMNKSFIDSIKLKKKTRVDLG